MKSLRVIPIGWAFFIIACLACGIAFRSINLDHKVYWNDETYTSLRISGYSEVEVIKSLSNKGLISAAGLQKYQFPTDPNKNISDTISGLAQEEPQLTPFFFGAVRLWTEWFGNSVAVIRSFSIVAALLAFPCVWWLCMELFETPMAAWAGMIILAVSPYQMLYSQEARPVAWWTTATLLSSAALLRALRVKTKISWLTYAATMAFSFYTFLFAGLVAIAHAIYVVVLEQFKVRRKVVIACILALILATIVFLPWLLTVTQNSSQAAFATAWSRGGRPSVRAIYETWANHFILPFIDPYLLQESFSQAPSLLRRLPTLLYWAYRLLLLYSFYVLCRQTRRGVWLFVVTLTAIPALALISPDLVLGGGISTNPRYIVPVYLGLQLALTYLFSQWLFTAVKPANWQTKSRQGIATALISISLGFCLLHTQIDAGWNKRINKTNPQVAQIINQTESPLVISDADLGDLFSLSYFLDPKVRLLVRPQSILSNINREYAETPYIPEIPEEFSDVFLFKPRPLDGWLKNLDRQHRYQFEALSQGFDKWFWKMKRS